MKGLFENTLKVENFKRPLPRKWNLSSNNRLISKWKTKTSFVLKKTVFGIANIGSDRRKHGAKHSNMLGFISISHGQLCISTSSTRNNNINETFIKKVATKRNNIQCVENFNSPYIFQQLHNN